MSRRTTVVAVLAMLLLMAGATSVHAQPALPEVGQEVPDFTLPVLDYATSTLSEHRGEGPVVLVFFRGAW